MRYMSNDGTGWVLDPEVIDDWSDYADMAIRDGVPYILYANMLDDEFAPHLAFPLE